jgi:hypothetical protein
MIAKVALVRIALCNAPVVASACCGDTSGCLPVAAASADATARPLRVLGMAEIREFVGPAKRFPLIAVVACADLYACEQTTVCLAETPVLNDLAYGSLYAPHEPHDREQYYGSQKRDHQRAYAEIALIDRRRSEYVAQQPSAESCADDSNHDVENDPLPAVRAHEDARYPPDQSADQEPNDEVHEIGTPASL